MNPTRRSAPWRCAPPSASSTSAGVPRHAPAHGPSAQRPGRPTAVRLARSRAAGAVPSLPTSAACSSRVGDVLIPGRTGCRPPARPGVADGLLDELLRARPDLCEPLHRRWLPYRRGPFRCRLLKALGRPTFATLSLVVAGAYYLSPRVRDLLDWHSERGRPIEMGAFPEYISEGLLDHLVELSRRLLGCRRASPSADRTRLRLRAARAPTRAGRTRVWSMPAAASSSTRLYDVKLTREMAALYAEVRPEPPGVARQHPSQRRPLLGKSGLRRRRDHRPSRVRRALRRASLRRLPRPFG